MDDLSLNPTPDVQSPTGVYIPIDLQDCFHELDKMLPANVRNQIQDGSETDLSLHHFGLGIWMRNKWGLWSDEFPLKLYFARMGVYDADSISNLILSSYWRYLNGKPLNLPQQIVYDKIMRDEIENGPKPSS